MAGLAAALLGGCGKGGNQAQAAVTVDTVLPGRQALARFREGLPETDTLGGAYAADRDTLVSRFVTALERADTAAFMPMMMSRGEFAWLYYENDPQSKPPYDLPPELMWMQTMQQGERGIGRALTRFGGKPLQYRGYACESEAQRGPNHVWMQCLLDIADGEGKRVKARLFGGIIEHGGRYKIFSYANDL
jgi:hypothetical protein